MSKAARLAWMALGALALALGAIGIVLPILPTTPFLLVAAFAFGRASPRVEAWLLGHRIFGPPILDWRRHGAIRPRVKVLSVLTMLGVLALGLAVGLRPGLLALQAICLTGAATFILSRPNGPA